MIEEQKRILIKMFKKMCIEICKMRERRDENRRRNRQDEKWKVGIKRE